MTTYFVDPGAGADTNSGLSQALAWRTLPGTKTVANWNTFLRTSWGTITAGAKIQPGDIIKIKPGTTHSSANGGAILIDPTYYANGTIGAKITITLDSTWATGDFTIDGTGINIAAFWALFAVNNLSYIEIKGLDYSNRFVVINANGNWGVLLQGASSPHKVGMLADYFDVSACSQHGMDISWFDASTISHTKVHHCVNAAVGGSCGQVNDQNCDNLTWSDCEFYNIGTNSTGQSLAQGCQASGCTNVLFLRCIFRNNRRDGLDLGSAAASNGNSFSVKCVNCDFYDNGEDCVGSNAGPSVTHSLILINCRLFAGGQGSLTAYDGVQVEAYHCVFHWGNNNSANGGMIFVFTDTGYSPPNVKLRNCIMYKPRQRGCQGIYPGGGADPTFDSNFNMWIPRAANSEIGFELPPGTTFTYAAPPAFIGANDKVGIAFDPLFVNAVSAVGALPTNDYHLLAGSPAINAGTFITVPAEAQVDRDGVTRANPPEIGLYEFGTGGTVQQINVPAAALTLTKTAPQVMPIMIPRANLSLSAKVPTIASIAGRLSPIFNAGRGILSPIFSTAVAVPVQSGSGASRVGFSSRVAAGAAYFTNVSGISSVSAAQSSVTVVQNFNTTLAGRFGVSSRSAATATQTGGPTTAVSSGRSSFGVSSSLQSQGQVDIADTDTASSFGVSSANTIRAHGTLVWDRIVSPGGTWVRIEPP